MADHNAFGRVVLQVEIMYELPKWNKDLQEDYGVTDLDECVTIDSKEIIDEFTKIIDKHSFWSDNTEISIIQKEVIQRQKA